MADAKRTVQIDIDARGAERGARTAEAALALGRQWGWLSANDCRRLLDMEPIGPEGDVYLQPMNMGPAGDDEPDDETQRRAGALRRVK